MQQNLTSWLRNNLGLAVLLVVSFSIYAPSLSGDFVMDDIPFIRDNPYIREVGHIARYFTKSVWENSAIGLENVSIYRPMNLVPLMLNYKLWGAHPFGYHVFLLLLHLANTCLVYALIRKVASGSGMAAMIGAAMFVLHPAKVESVAWIGGGVDPLVAFFLLAAMLAHRSFSDNLKNNKEWRYLALSLLCFQLALWSKEVALVFPLIVVAHDLIYKSKINWLTAFLHSVVVVAYLIARSLVLGGTGKWDALGISQFSKAFDFALGYSELLVFPAKIPFYLQSPDHSVSSALGVIGAIVVAILAGFSWRIFNMNGRKTLAFSATWMIVFFWPAAILAFYAEGYYAARHLYVPSIGAAFFVAAFYDRMNAVYPTLKIPIMASCALIVAFYGFVTLKEIPAWRDDGAIYSKIARLAPKSSSGFSGLGNYYLMREDYAAAEKNYLMALKNSKSPQDRVDALLALGTIQGMSNNPVLSERYLKEVLQIDPKNSDGWAGLGNLALMQGRFYEAIPLYEKAISIRPTNYEATMNLATAYEKTGQSVRGASIRQQAYAIRR